MVAASRGRKNAVAAARRAEPLAPRIPTELAIIDIEELHRLDEWAGLAIEDVIGQRRAEFEFDFVSCDISGTTFNKVALTGASCSRSRIVDTVFDACELSGVDLSESTLVRVEFRECRMSGLQLSSARIHDARFVDCKLDDANVRMAEFARVRVDRGSLRGADFTGSKGCDIAIFDADLERCDFTKSQLARFMLHGSQIADVQGAIALRAATIDSSQQIPLALKLLAESGTIISDDRDS